jgi:hypothetical protein
MHWDACTWDHRWGWHWVQLGDTLLLGDRLNLAGVGSDCCSEALGRHLGSH